jgi:hypothetical protein
MSAASCRFGLAGRRAIVTVEARALAVIGERAVDGGGSVLP